MRTGLVVRLQWYFWNREYRESYCGIKIVGESDGGPANEALFCRLAREALRCIERYDPRRFRRVLREVDYIVNHPLPFLVRASPSYRSISLDLAHRIDRFALGMNHENEEWYVAWLATLLVREATRARLHTRGFQANGRHSLRISRLCHAEQYRFARRKLPAHLAQYADHLVPPFDPSSWEPLTFRGRFVRARTMYARMRLYFQRRRELPRPEKKPRGRNWPWA